MNELEDLDELERMLGPSLQVALRRVAAELSDAPPPLDVHDPDTAELTVLGADPPGPPRRHRRLLAVAAAVVGVLVVGSILVRDATDGRSPGPVNAGPSPAPTSDHHDPSSERPGAIPPADLPPSTPETGTLLADLPDRPLFIYEDGRVIWPESTSSRDAGLGWVERQLTPPGLELVRAEIRSGGHLDPATPPPYPSWRRYWDGARQLYTQGWPPQAEDLSWVPAGAWADAGPTPFVASRYAVCLGWPGTDSSALLARLPADVADVLGGANHDVAPPPMETVDTMCFDLTIDEAREVEASVEAAGALRPWNDMVYVFDQQGDSSTSIMIGFTPHLPHGSPVYVQEIA